MTRGTKWLAGILSVLFVFSQLQLWGDGRIFHIWELHRLNLASQTENDRLKVRNSSLEREIANLKSGVGAIEREAREELGMVKQGETFFRLVGDTPVQDPTRQ